MSLRLNPALPQLEDEDGNPIQFRRTLLNKCQVEFEQGALAMKAVADRERREKEHRVRANARRCVCLSMSMFKLRASHVSRLLQDETPEEVEDVEITDEKQQERDAVAEAKRQDREAAAREVAARKRMLGNIIFVGNLYRFGVLTESVMRNCIEHLLQEVRGLCNSAVSGSELSCVWFWSDDGHALQLS